MKVELVITKTSNVMAPSSCPQGNQAQCGILYRIP